MYQAHLLAAVAVVLLASFAEAKSLHQDMIRDNMRISDQGPMPGLPIAMAPRKGAPSARAQEISKIIIERPQEVKKLLKEHGIGNDMAELIAKIAQKAADTASYFAHLGLYTGSSITNDVAYFIDQVLNNGASVIDSILGNTGFIKWMAETIGGSVKDVAAAVREVLKSIDMGQDQITHGGADIVKNVAQGGGQIIDKVVG